MLNRILPNPTWPDDRPALITSGTTTTWGELRALVADLAVDETQLQRRRVGLLFRPTAECLATLAQLDRLDCDVFLMDGNLQRDDAVRLGTDLRLGLLLLQAPGAKELERIALDDELPGTGQSSVTILTSGTTGKPKAARHTWESLSRPVRASANANGPRWLLVYRPHLYAGLQVLLQCLVNGGTLVVPEPDSTPSTVADLMKSTGVEFASATPSYWRRLLLFADSAVLAAVPLLQITIGGEVVDQSILDGLHRVFPKTRITHIYATTELGRCFSVTDGKAGFPLRYLSEETADGILMRIEDGELVVRSANAMKTYDNVGAGAPQGEWGFHTGDLVEIVDDRVFFVGRRSDMINVGGNKVHPLEVERVLRTVPGVLDTRVYGKKSSIAGELVAAHVVPAAGVDTVALREAIVNACIDGLTPMQRPRLIDFVADLALEDSGKIKRRLSS